MKTEVDEEEDILVDRCKKEREEPYQRITSPSTPNAELPEQEV